jgi:hypothetical protein
MFEIDAITPNASPRRLRFHSTIQFLRGLGLTLAVVVAAWLAVLTTARAQTDYVFSNASAVLNGTPVTITGLFTVDPTSEWYAQIQITGPSPYAGVYSCFVCNDTGAGPLSPISRGGDLIMASEGLNTLQISFSNNSLASVGITGKGPPVTDAAPTGVIVPTGTPTDYVFSNASAVLNGTLETISGGFGFDPLTSIEYGALVGFTGPASSSEGFFDTEYVRPDRIALDFGNSQGGGIIFDRPSRRGRRWLRGRQRPDWHCVSDGTPRITVSRSVSCRGPRAHQPRPPGRRSRSVPSQPSGDPTRRPTAPPIKPEGA